MFLTLGSGPQDKKWRQRLRSWDKSCLGGWVAWWFGGTAAANVLSQWCGISFIAAEWMVVTEGRCRCGGEYFRSPHTQPLSPFSHLKLSALWVAHRPLLGVSFRPGSFRLARSVAFALSFIRSFVLTFAFCLCPQLQPHSKAPNSLSRPHILPPKEATVGRCGCQLKNASKLRLRCGQQNPAMSFYFWLFPCKG